MIDLTTESITWSSEDIAVFRTFLNTQSGQKFLPKLLENVPLFMKGGATNDILFRTGEIAAWGEAFRAIMSLANPPPKTHEQSVHSNNMPALDDDASWSDGQTTTT